MFEKINQIVMFVFIAIGVFFGVMTFTDFDMSGDTAICNACWPVQGFIVWSYVLLILAIVAALAGAVISAIVNPKGIKGTAIGLGVMLVVVGISYALSSGEVLEKYPDGITETASKWSGTGLYVFYILFVLAILSIIYSAISKAFK